MWKTPLHLGSEALLVKTAWGRYSDDWGRIACGGCIPDGARQLSGQSKAAESSGQDARRGGWQARSCWDTVSEHLRLSPGFISDKLICMCPSSSSRALPSSAGVKHACRKWYVLLMENQDGKRKEIRQPGGLARTRQLGLERRTCSCLRLSGCGLVLQNNLNEPLNCIVCGQVVNLYTRLRFHVNTCAPVLCVPLFLTQGLAHSGVVLQGRQDPTEPLRETGTPSEFL